MANSTESSIFSSSTNIYRSPFPSLPLPPPDQSLPSFLLSSVPRPDRPAFISSSESLSYSALFSLASSISHSLTHSFSIRPDDTVLLLSPNSLLFPPIALGVLSSRAVLSTANPLLTPRELLSLVELSRPALILTTPSLAPKLHALVPPSLILLIPHLLHSLIPITTLPTHKLQSSSAPAALMYSSGTTGRSKGVLCSHRSLVHIASVLRSVWGERSKKEVYLCAVPMFHMFGFSMFVVGAVAAGATVVVMERYTAEGVMDAVESYGVTRMPAVPPMLVQMVRMRRRRSDLGTLREVICSGAPLAKELMETFVQCYPSLVLSQCYGLTETCGPITLCDGMEGNFHLSIGRLIPSVEAKIIDEPTGKPLPPNKVGELFVRGPPIMQGYLNNPEATSLAIDEEGWFRTGDLCYIDEKGLVFLAGRLKELIKYKAYQVAPVELEEILATHPGIEDVAVTSFPDEEAGEIPMACVVKKAGFELQKDEVIAFMDNKVAPYKKIRKVMFVEHIPRTPSGKIIRRLLKDSEFTPQRPEISARL